MKNVTTATTKELVQFFNANCAVIGANPVKRFADRKTAERRVNAVIEAMPAPEAPKAEKTAAEKRTRSEAVAATWKNAATVEKRATRHAVIYTNAQGQSVEFSSLRKAFAALDLPDSKHIPFRQILKREKKATFTFGKNSWDFALAE